MTKSKVRQRTSRAGGKINGLINLNFGNRINSKMYDYPATIEMSLVDGQIATAKPDPYRVVTQADAVAMVDLVIPKVRKSRSAFDQMVGVMMNKLRTISTSTVTYTPGYLATYLLNLRSINAEIIFLLRYLSAVRSFEPYDADSPRSLQTVCFPGQAYPENANVAELINRLNALLARVGTLLPAATPFVGRSASMFSYVLRDSTQAKYSKKAYVLARAPKFKTAENDFYYQEGGINNFDNKGNPVSLLTLVNDIESWVGEMAREPVNINIAADMLKAFGTGAIQSFPVVSPNSMLVPIYDEKLLNAWENMTVMPIGRKKGLTNFSIDYLGDESTGAYVTSEVEFTAAESGALSYTSTSEFNVMTTEGLDYKRVNVNKDSPDSGDTLNAVSFTSIYDLAVDVAVRPKGGEAAGNESVLTITTSVSSTPGEVIMGYYYRYNGGFILASPEIVTSKQPVTGGTNAVSIQIQARTGSSQSLSSAWSINDWEPALPLSAYQILYDLKNWAIVDSSNLSAFIEWMVTGLSASPSHVVAQDKFVF